MLVGLAVVWLVLVAVGLSMGAAALLVIGVVLAALYVYVVIDGFRAARRDGRSAASALGHGLWELQEFWVPSTRRKR